MHLPFAAPEEDARHMRVVLSDIGVIFTSHDWRLADGCAGMEPVRSAGKVILVDMRSSLAMFAVFRTSVHEANVRRTAGPLDAESSYETTRSTRRGIADLASVRHAAQNPNETVGGPKT